MYSSERLNFGLRDYPAGWRESRPLAYLGIFWHNIAYYFGTTSTLPSSMIWAGIIETFKRKTNDRQFDVSFPTRFPRLNHNPKRQCSILSACTRDKLHRCSISWIRYRGWDYFCHSDRDEWPLPIRSDRGLGFLCHARSLLRSSCPLSPLY